MGSRVGDGLAVGESVGVADMRQGEERCREDRAEGKETNGEEKKGQ